MSEAHSSNANFQQYKRAKGKWLQRTPIDRISGKPLSFRIKDDSLVIYSLGHDGDDDDGVNTDSDMGWRATNEDGDWVVWPQSDRR